MDLGRRLQSLNALAVGYVSLGVKQSFTVVV